jgi:hypothetical protein
MQDRGLPDQRGLAPAFAATRARLGLVAVLFVVAALCWWFTAEQMAGMDDGPWSALGALGWFSLASSGRRGVSWNSHRAQAGQK